MGAGPGLLARPPVPHVGKVFRSPKTGPAVGVHGLWLLGMVGLRANAVLCRPGLHKQVSPGEAAALSS